ncbi:MAG: Ig-like domain-containing protein [Elusimicrobiota bacterium]
MKKKLVVLAAVLLLAASGWAVTPGINGFSSQEGGTDHQQDLMYQVSSGNNLIFTVSVNQPVTFEWAVNKSTIASVNPNTFSWTVPEEKGIWEIHLRCWNASNEETHQEWVVSTLTADEAPTVFDYFTDKKSSGRSEADPWGRALPEWSGGSEAPHVTSGFVNSSEGITWSRTPSRAAYGTWKFKYRFPEAMNGQRAVAGFGFNYIQASGSSGGTYSFSQLSDSHHHCVITHSEADFSIDYDDGVYLRDPWYTVTIVRTPDGWLYMYRNDRIEFLAHDEKVAFSETVFLDMRNTQQEKIYFDCLEIYKDKFLFPGENISYTEYTSNYEWKNGHSYPLKKEGIVLRGRGITLAEIAQAVNPALFAYNQVTKTAISYVNLVVDEGAELLINNETLKFSGSADGGLEFALKYASRLEVQNSTIASDNQFYWVWNISGSTTHYGYETKLAEGFYPDYYDFVMVLAGAYHGCFIAKNSVIDNSAHLFFDSPYDLDISETKITNLHETDIGNYTFTGSYSDPVRDLRTHLKGEKGFWVCTDDINLDNFNLRNISFAGSSLFNLTFLINAYRDRLNVYDLNLTNGNILIKESLAGTASQSHTVNSDGPPYDWKSYLDSGLGLVNCKFGEVSLSPGLFADCDGKPVRKFAAVKNYLDIQVVDVNKNPVSGASVTARNEIDNRNFPVENISTSKPYTGDADAVDGGEYEGFYHHRRVLQGAPVVSALTGTDGHTALPSDKENSLVVTDYVKKIEDSPDGLKISWVSLWTNTRYVGLDLYNSAQGNIAHQVNFVNLQSGAKHHYRISYNAENKTIALLVTVPGGQTVWDSGALKIEAEIAPLRFNQIAFRTRKQNATNNIAWDSGKIKLETSVYRGKFIFNFDNLKLTVHDSLLENNDFSTAPNLLGTGTEEKYYNLAASTDGKSFIWEFDLDLTEFDTDGPQAEIWLRDSNDLKDATVKTINYTYTIKAEKDGLAGEIKGVDPDSGWYRTNPDLPSKTVVVVLGGQSYITDDESKPTVLISSPLDGAKVFGVVPVKAAASDNYGVNKVEFYLDDLLVSSISAPPYQWLWDTQTAAEGDHRLKVVAYDGNNNQAENTITVKVVRLASLVVYPNPFIKGKSGESKIIFANLPAIAEIRIYTVSGKLLWTVEHKDSVAGGLEEWDVSEIDSGIYLYTIISSEGKKKGKVSIVK